MSDSVQEVKDKLNVVDVVGSYVRLTKAGKYHKGLCPFHNERTPSFMVSPERGFYHCFGCGKGGDIFSFVQDIEGLDFRGALKLLADKAGVVIENEPRENKDEKEKMLAALKDAESFYVSELGKREDVKEYLFKRALKMETLEKFRVGYAPNEWRALSDHLVQAGHTEVVIEDVGLSKRPESAQGTVDGAQEVGDTKQEAQSKEREGTKRPYDRLRGRIIFPIRDISGRVVGFSGRIFEDDPKHPQAKYINSPETKVFHKSSILYGLDMAKEGIRKYGFALLVEGQVDLLMAHQSGFTNAVALSGTSFTEAHAALIKRHTENLLIVFDGDAAGIAAAGRAAALALPAGLNTKVALLPTGMDPADLLQKDIAGFKKQVREAKHVVDFYLKHVRESGLDERMFKIEASRIVLPFVNLIQNAIDREHFISRVAAVLEVSPDAVRQELTKLKEPNRKVVVGDTGRGVQKEGVPADPFLSRSDTLVRLLGGMLLVFKEQKDEEHYAQIHEVLISILGEKETASLTENPEDIRASIIEADIHISEYEDAAALDAAVTELLGDFKRETAHKKYQEASRELKRLEAAGLEKEMQELLQEVDRLAKEL